MIYYLCNTVNLNLNTMAKISLHLPDNNRYTKDSVRTLMLAFSSCGKTSYAQTGIRLTKQQWDKKQQCVVRHPDAGKLTLEAHRLLIKAQDAMLKVSDGFDVGCIDSMQLRDLVMQSLVTPDISTKLVLNYMKQYMEMKEKKNTKSVYSSTISRMKQFNPKVDSLVFDAVNPTLLRRFDKWLSEHGCPSMNARAVHFRNLRTVFNAAIDDGLTLNYPFRKFKIRGEPTKPRALPVETLRKLIDSKLVGSEANARDCFMLSFYMIGINMADLILLECSGKKVKYYRQKTGKPYEFALQPEAERLLDVLHWVKHYKNAHSLVIMINRLLKQVGKKIGYKPLTTYCARYTWATIAASLDIPKETIAAALGHSNTTVTDTYITFDHSKIDKANRAVIDYVLNRNE